MFDVKTDFTTYKNCHFVTSQYITDDNLAIIILDTKGMGVATITKCLNDISIKPNESYVDVNNCPWAIDLIQSLGVGKLTGKERKSGYCTYPVVKFDLEKLENA